MSYAPFAKLGMDHPHYGWNPIAERPRLTWPNGAPLALCVVVHLEHYEPSSAIQHSEYSRRAYGTRVGIFRIMEAMARVGVRATVALDVHTATHAPYLVNACRSEHWEFMGHGVVGSRPITSLMSEADERTEIIATLDGLEAQTGTRPTGWLGAEFGESTRTPALLAECGLRYVCDWPNDEQPYAMTVPSGSLVSLPMLLELDDVFALEQRHLTTWRWQQAVEETADVLTRDGAQQARLLTLSIHPWVMGQPHRIRIFESVLRNLVSGGAWAAAGREIVDAFSLASGAQA